MAAAGKNNYVHDLLMRAFRHKLLLGLTIASNAMSLALAFVIPWMIGSAIDDVIIPSMRNPGDAKRMHWLTALVMIGVATAALTGIVIYVRGHYTVKLGNRVINDLRTDLFDHLQSLSLHFYSKERTGTIVSRLMNDIHQATNLINGGMLMVGIDAIQAIFAIGMLLAISWKLTLASMSILPLFVLTFYAFNSSVRIASDHLLQQQGKITGDLQEHLAGIAVVKANSGEERELRRFEEESGKYFDRVVAQSKITNMTAAISETLLQIGVIIIVGYGSFLAVQRAELTAGDLTRFLGYMSIMYGPARRFAELNNVYQTSLAALNRVFVIFEISPKIVNKRNARMVAPREGEVRFEGVRFRYRDGSDESTITLASPETIEKPDDRWVLKGIDFHIKAHERIAFVGASGAGKSTIASMIPRLYDPTEGTIHIDRVDIRDYNLRQLRSTISIVQQESFLFTGTVRDNLAYARPEASEKEVIAAAIAANAHEFILEMPNGYQTYLGERGINLSGGQRQRLAIARAILKNPRILILDEATSALDAHNEAQVQGALANLMKDRTTIIIAHRLSTIRNANRILVIDQGRIIESGSHDELMGMNGMYASLVQSQSRGTGGEGAPAPAAAAGAG